MTAPDWVVEKAMVCLRCAARVPSDEPISTHHRGHLLILADTFRLLSDHEIARAEP